MSRVVVTGGAGFLGSHLSQAFLDRGDEVVCIDNLSTGSLENVRLLSLSPSFQFVEADICGDVDIDGPIDIVAHLACPASPPEYLRMPLETLSIGSRGSETVLELARRSGARVLLASTSEIYGNPLVSPQEETYWGNVNPIGPRSVYDEAKRFAEAFFMAHRRVHGTNIGVVRIFNTYGPRLRPIDGRVVSNFVAQAIAGEPLTIYGEGSQTRSFCYVDDLVRGLLAMADSTVTGPVNLGNPIEMTVRQLADLVLELTNSDSEIEYCPLPVDDPRTRRPNIALAAELLGWKPEIGIREGLTSTIDWQRSVLAKAGQ